MAGMRPCRRPGQRCPSTHAWLTLGPRTPAPPAAVRVAPSALWRSHGALPLPLWPPAQQVMERGVYAAIKRSDQEQIAAERRALVEHVPLLAVLAPVRRAGRGPVAPPPTPTWCHMHVPSAPHAAAHGPYLLPRFKESTSPTLSSPSRVPPPSDHPPSECVRPRLTARTRRWPGSPTRPPPARRALQEHKAVVADALELVEFQAGQAVFRQGEAGDRFYVIREGTGGGHCRQAAVHSVHSAGGRPPEGCRLSQIGMGAARCPGRADGGPPPAPPGVKPAVQPYEPGPAPPACPQWC